jgi:PAS domain S-box-containing protein
MINAQSVLDAAPDAMVVVDEKGTIVLANLWTEKFFVWNRDELVGKPVEILIPERFRSSHLDHRSRFFQAAHRRPMGAGLNLHALRKDGEEVPVEISLSPLVTDGRTMVIATIRDVTGRRDAQTTGEDWARRLAHDAQRTAVEADRIKDEFLATFSHELRTLLSATEPSDHDHTTPTPERNVLDHPLPDDPPDLHGVTVLVVEDEDGPRDFLKTLMTRAGTRAITAVSGVEALAVAVENRPDIVICTSGCTGTMVFRSSERFAVAVPQRVGGFQPWR